MFKLKPLFSGRAAALPAFACAASFVLFAWICSQFYLPGKGFTYLIEFGARERARFIPEVRAVNHYEIPDSSGYDAQYYAQIAMRPRLDDPVLRRAVDSLPYRARRILFCWTAWLLAGGRPVLAMQIYAFQNIVAWFLLGILLWRWLPPNRLENWARWAAILFSFGLCCSVRGALVDGPSLLLIAAAMALLESGRAGWATAVLGLSGLGKETNLLAAVAWLPDRGAGRREALRAFGRIALAALPLALWVAWLTHRMGGSGEMGARNFSWPFAGYAGKWRELSSHWRIHGFDAIARGDLLVLIALSVQLLFFALRPRWSDRWWRLGAVYALLMVVLGPAVWEGYPGAAARVLLPLTLAFNLIVPRGRVWLLVLIAGNLSVFISRGVLRPPGRESYTVSGPRALRIEPGTGRIVEAIFDSGWYPPEKSWLEYWRWCRGDGDVTFRNPHPFPVLADISFGLRANDRRTLEVCAGTGILWRGKVEGGRLREIRIAGVRLPPGDTTWRFETDQPPIRASAVDARPLTFSLRNLKLRLRRPPG
ncbi:MAG: hypothetical protein ACREFX_14085 [Opitutaceae bacterium]